MSQGIDQGVAKTTCNKNSLSFAGLRVPAMAVLEVCACSLVDVKVTRCQAVFRHEDAENELTENLI